MVTPLGLLGDAGTGVAGDCEAAVGVLSAAAATPAPAMPALGGVDVAGDDDDDFGPKNDASVVCLRIEVSGFLLPRVSNPPSRPCLRLAIAPLACNVDAQFDGDAACDVHVEQGERRRFWCALIGCFFVRARARLLVTWPPREASTSWAAGGGRWCSRLAVCVCELCAAADLDRASVGVVLMVNDHRAGGSSSCLVRRHAPLPRVPCAEERS